MEWMYRGEMELVLQLTAAGEPQIQLLAGIQWGEVQTQKTFKDATWIFYPDDKFVFIPTRTAFSGDTDTLFTITGTYLKVGNTLEFEAHNQRRGLSASVDGTILINGESIAVNAIFTVSAINALQQVAKVFQYLSSKAPSISYSESKIEEVEIEGVLVPSKFRISLTGTTSGQNFGPLSGTLKILQNPAGSSQPFRVTLATDSLDSNGSISWNPLTTSEIRQGQLSKEILVNNGQVKLEIESCEDDTQITSTWFTTLAQQRPFRGIPVPTSSIKRGTLTFSVQDDLISGEVTLSGNPWLGEIETYQANFTGHRQNQSSVLPKQTLLAEAQTAPNLTSSSNVTEIEGIKVSNVFNIFLEGKTEAGAFGRLSGKLFISQPDAGASHPLSVHISTSNINPITNGCLLLHSEVQGKDAPNTQLQVSNGQIHLEIESSKHTRSITWAILPPDAPLEETFRVVQTETGTLTLSFKGNKVSGKIDLFGLANATGIYNQPTTYEAVIEGELEKSLLVEKLRAALASSFSIRWDMGEPFKTIELQQDGQKVRGTYTGRGGGIIEGIVRGERLDFTWKDNLQGQGWGFFRAAFHGGSLVGFWGQDAEKTDGQLIMGNWQIPTFLEPLISDPLTPLDAQELQYLGRDLIAQNRCREALIVLEKSLAFYKEERQKPKIKYNDYENYLGSEASVLGNLLICSFQLGNYDKLLQSLEYGLELQHLSSPAEYSSRLFRKFTANVVDILTQQSDLFGIIYSTFTKLQKKAEVRCIDGIGITLEQDENTKDLIINTTVKNSPAYLAGILPLDVLVEIDGYNTAGIDVKQADERLQGQKGTKITLSVRRGKKQLNFKLTRTQVEIYTIKRQTELLEALAFLADYSKNLQLRLAAEQNKISTLKNKIAEEQIEFIPALVTVSQNLENLIMQLDKENSQIIALGKEFFKEERKLARYSDIIFNALYHKTCTLPDIDIKKIADAQEEFMISLKRNRELTLVEKQFFCAYIGKVSSLQSTFFRIECERSLIARIEKEKIFDKRLKLSQDASAKFANYLERWRVRLINDLDKIDALEKGQPFFQKLIKLLVELGDEKGALVASEKSRARAFADLLSARLSSSLVPRYSADTPTIKKIQQIAQEKKATLIEYTIIYDLETQRRESKLLIWVVKHTGKIEFSSINLEFPEQTNNISLEEMVAKARASIGIENEDVAEFRPPFIVENKWFYPHLRQLYQILIESIAKFLPDDPSIPIIFIPQDFLFLIPFTLLQDEESNFLIQKHTILTAPSIQVLDLIHQPRKEILGTSINALVVGNPTMPSLALEVDEEPEQLESLPASEAEAKAIASLLNTQALIADQATKANIVQQMPKARLIHLATHGLVDEIRPLGIIALSPYEDDNGVFTTKEIMEIFGQPHKPSLQVELLVLSACQTGQGKVSADGVIGLSRSLMAVGVSRLIVSLWAVNDLATAFLMIKFHEMLNNYVKLKPADVTKILNQAQQWLASLSCEEAKQELEKIKPYIYQASSETSRTAEAYMKYYLKICDRGPYPFASPKYWAAFVTIGL